MGGSLGAVTFFPLPQYLAGSDRLPGSTKSHYQLLPWPQHPSPCQRYTQPSPPIHPEKDGFASGRLSSPYTAVTRNTS